MEGMDQLVQKYQDLKEQINALEAEKSEIAKKFRAGLVGFGVEAIKIPVNGVVYQLKLTTRGTHSCQWEAFKNVHPDLYAQYVVDSQAEYVDVRKVRATAGR